MGNCQASDAATVVIVHPGRKIERIFRSVIGREIIDSNPGHYLANSVVVKSVNGSPPVKQLKLLRPDDTLLIGQVYRLISFEDVLQEIAAKKCLKLRKLINERGLIRPEKKIDVAGAPATTPIPPKWRVDAHIARRKTFHVLQRVHTRAIWIHRGTTRNGLTSSVYFPWTLCRELFHRRITGTGI